MNVKKAVRMTGNILSTLFLIVSVAVCIVVFATNYSCKTSGEEPFYLGYRPCFIKTGSMEPYMKTYGMIMTKKVNSIDDIKVGDVVTYRLKNDNGEMIYITHRIQDISADGYITTKGDNNAVSDGYLLTMDNIIAKEIGVFNQPSQWIVSTWEGGVAGKVMIVSIVIAIIAFFYLIGRMLSDWLNTDEIQETDFKEYLKLCKKLNESPREMFLQDLARLRDLVEQQENWNDDIEESTEITSAQTTEGPYIYR